MLSSPEEFICFKLNSNILKFIKCYKRHSSVGSHHICGSLLLHTANHSSDWLMSCWGEFFFSSDKILQSVYWEIVACLPKKCFLEERHLDPWQNTNNTCVCIIAWKKNHDVHRFHLENRIWGKSMKEIWCHKRLHNFALSTTSSNQILLPTLQQHGVSINTHTHTQILVDSPSLEAPTKMALVDASWRTASWWTATTLAFLHLVHVRCFSVHVTGLWIATTWW